MNFEEIKNAVKYIKKNCRCGNCGAKFKNDELIHIIASTRNEVLTEQICETCGTSTLLTVIMTMPYDEKNIKELSTFSEEDERQHKSISQNDILDIKNFLNKFDGDFDKIFKK